MSNETELLERAVINLSLENASLKTKLKEVTKDKKLFFDWYSEKRELAEELEKELADLESANKDMNPKSKDENITKEDVDKQHSKIPQG